MNYRTVKAITESLGLPIRQIDLALAAAAPSVLALLKEIERLRAASSGAAKPSPCCPGDHLVPMHGTDTKLCTGCKVEQHWPLEPGQRRTFD